MTNQPKTIKLVCRKCGDGYYTDAKRSQRILTLLKTAPTYLADYECRACRKGLPPKNGSGESKPAKAQERAKSGKTSAEPTQGPSKGVMGGIDPYAPIAGKDDLTKYVPDQEGTYVSRTIGGVADLDLLKYHYLSDDPRMKNVLLVGETGTGKTMLVREFCARNKLPYYRVVMNAGTTTDDIIGQMIMQPDGTFRFSYQVLLKFMEQGGVFVFDEINGAQKEILFVLNSITDFERRAVITQHQGEIIKAHPRFLVVACMNPPEEYDIDELNKALASRFVHYDFPYDEDIDRKVLGKGEAKLIALAKKIRQARAGPKKEIITPLSTRDLVQFKTLRDDLGYDLAKTTLLAKFHPGEREVVKTMLAVHLEKSEAMVGGDDPAAQNGNGGAQ